jgi:hypothetical protein
MGDARQHRKDRSLMAPSKSVSRRRLGALSLLTLGLPVLAACGSSPKPASTAAALGTPLQQACTAVTDVLGNGPDPDGDPVGYAEAQPIQLRKVKTADAKLHSAIEALADAYQSFAETNGGAAAKAAVKAAAARVDAICPGATS